MVTELVNRASFRYKVFIAVAVFMVVLLLIYNRPPKNPLKTKPLLFQKTNFVNLNTSGGTIKDPLLDAIVYVEDNFETLDQKDPQLIRYTRAKYLNPPSKLPYNFDYGGDHRDTFSGWVANFFKNKQGGIFIEAGAWRGESASHTLYLELELGWTGVLIECNPVNIPYLKTKHRKAWVAEVCLSPTKTPGTIKFSNPESYSPSGSVKKEWNPSGLSTKWTYFEVQTIPLYTILAALGLKEVDYFSFDIESQELNVLRNFPFDLVMFKVIIMEVHFYNDEELAELNQLLVSNGYRCVKKFEFDNVYVHENFLPPLTALTVS